MPCGNSTRVMPFSWTEIGLPTYTSIEAPMKVLGGVTGVNVYGMDMEWIMEVYI